MNYQTPEGCSPAKAAILRKAHEYVIPGRVERFHEFGIDLVIGKREGYRIWDIDGHELMDFHLNGGTYNLGHRNPVIIDSVRKAMDTLDVGNHHFPSGPRADLAERLAALTPKDLHYTVFAAGGSEANDIAIKSARWATGKRKIIGVDVAYHGRTGLSGAAGDDGTHAFFKSDYPDDFLKVPFEDLDAMERALAKGDVAAVIMETILATYGFPVPSAGYLPGVKRLCEKYGALYIADEVQTGLGRTGHLWAVDVWDVVPDILVIGKGLSGGIYPIAATVMSKRVGGWLAENGWGHVSTFGGSEIGCHAALQSLEICADPANLEHARQISSRLHSGLESLQSSYSFLKKIDCVGLIMGLEFDSPRGGIDMMKCLYDKGIWAIFAGYKSSALQFKPGFLIDNAYCDEALGRFEDALRVCAQLPRGEAVNLGQAASKK